MQLGGGYLENGLIQSNRMAFLSEGQEDSLIGQIEKGIIQTQDLPGDIRLKTQHGRLIASNRIIKRLQTK